MSIRIMEANLLRCCGSTKWAKHMMAQGPFESREALFAKAEQIWKSLSREDWLEAFQHHPRIGGDLAKLREKYAETSQWAENEQQGVREADEAVLQALAQGNQDYEKRFGHLFLVCATGKSAREMLELLKQRMGNEPTHELKVAADEQAKIFRIRLEKLLKS